LGAGKGEGTRREGKGERGGRCEGLRFVEGRLCGGGGKGISQKGKKGLGGGKGIQKDLPSWDSKNVGSTVFSPKNKIPTEKSAREEAMRFGDIGLAGKLLRRRKVRGNGYRKGTSPGQENKRICRATNVKGEEKKKKSGGGKKLNGKLHYGNQNREEGRACR